MQIQSDVMDVDRARAMQAMLGQSQTIKAGQALPPFFHQLYFWDPHPPSALGRDGHPKVGGLIPDMGLPRRMWAGGRLVFHANLRAGIPAERRTSVSGSSMKKGRSGRLGFVTLHHEIWQDARLCVTDWQDLVYREDPGPMARQSPPPPARTDEDICETQLFDSTMLFRYSALTFNGHRIHYDRDYATQVEGYGGLVVHGPLLAQKLMLLCRAQMGGLKEFSFRATAPLLDTEKASFCWKDGQAWVRAPDGRQCIIATARC